MKIKRLHASFGKLKNDELTLKDGLNIITAPNEAGKSTWCAFIRAMLYGINSSERDKIGYLSDKTRYRPWSGSPMEGAMDLSSNGRDITLQRTSHGAAAMKKFSAVYTGTGEAVAYLDGEGAGETLTGVSEQVFERTAFIRQSKIHISQTAELERRISSLVSTGDEQSSYTETAEKLRAWQRKLQYNKSGSIPKTKAEIDVLSAKLKSLEEMHEDMGEMHHEIEQLTKIKDELLLEMELHDKIEEQSEYRKIAEAEKKEENAKNAVRQIKEQLKSGGIPISRDDVIKIKAALGTEESLRERCEDEKRKSVEAEQAYKKLLEEKSESPFYDMEAETVKKAAEDVVRIHDELREIKNKNRLPARVISLILAAIGIVGVILFSDTAIALCISAAIILAGGTIFITSFRNSGKRQEELLAKMLAKYGFRDVRSFLGAAENYLMLSSECDRAKERAGEAKQNIALSEAAFANCENTVTGALKRYFPEAKTREAAEKAVKDTEILFNMLSSAEAIAMAAAEVSAALKADFDGDTGRGLENLPKPQRTREESRAALSRTEEQLRAVTRTYNVLCGQAQAVGDPLVLTGEISKLKESLKEQLEKYEALTLALDTLGDAENELQLRFAPVLSQRAGEIMSRLTGGRYEKIFFDKKFDAEAREMGESVSHTSLALSEGTDNLLYLALRIAMCEFILTGDDPCPIILDDALFTFDDERMKKTLDFLRELSKERQVILFSCHEREAKYLENAPDVNTVKLKKIRNPDIR